MGVRLSKTYVVNYVISSSPSWQDGILSWHDMAWKTGMTWNGKQESGCFLALYFLWIQATSASCRSFCIGLDSSLRKDFFCVHWKTVVLAKDFIFLVFFIYLIIKFYFLFLIVLLVISLVLIAGVWSLNPPRGCDSGGSSGISYSGIDTWERTYVKVWNWVVLWKVWFLL